MPCFFCRSIVPYGVIKSFWEDSDWQEAFDKKGYGLLEIESDFKDYEVKFLMVEMKLRDARDKKEIIRDLVVHCFVVDLFAFLFLIRIYSAP